MYARNKRERDTWDALCRPFIFVVSVLCALACVGASEFFFKRRADRLIIAAGGRGRLIGSEG